MIKLSARLQTIADRVTGGSRLADIGSDHALLPVYLVKSGKCPSAIAGELNAGPFEAARRQIAEAGLQAAVDARRGDGLGVLSPGEADTVTIAGMGGSLMTDILEAGWVAGKLAGVRELVLQPNVGEESVRLWLVRRGYVLQDEAILEEDGRIYEVLHALAADETVAGQRNKELYDPACLPLRQPVKEASADERGAATYDPSSPPLQQVAAESADWLYRMGPHLVRAGGALLDKKWRLEIAKLERICAQLALSELDESRAKEAELRSEIKRIEEVLSCLPTVRPSRS